MLAGAGAPASSAISWMTKSGLIFVTDRRLKGDRPPFWGDRPPFPLLRRRALNFIIFTLLPKKIGFYLLLFGKASL
jgi:hypothetical protein